MYIPAYANVKFIKDDGFLTPDMQSYMDILNQSLQNGLSDNGWTFPPVTAAQLTALAPIMPNGTGWYEKDTGVIVFKLNGVLRQVTTAAYP